jgi:hypothetical protein
MKFKVALAALSLAVALTVVGCSASNEVNTTTAKASTTAASANTASIPSWSITVDVVGAATRQFTNEDAAKIGPVQIKAAQKDGDSMLTEQVWTGILMKDFLKYVGVDSYSVIQIVASDGFSQELAPADVTADGTGLGWAVDGKELDAKSGPVELVNNGRGPKWWVKQVSSITIVK